MTLLRAFPNEENRCFRPKRFHLPWPSRCSRVCSKFHPADRSPEDVAKAPAVLALHLMRDFEVLTARSPPGQLQQQSTQGHESSGGHTKPLAGRAVQPNVQRQVFMWAQQGGKAT